MKASDFVIACDMDDTIEYLVMALVEWLNNKYGTKVEYKDVNEWRVSNFFPTLTTDQVWEPLHHREFWKTVKPMKDAQVYIEKLIKEGFPFFIVTSSTPESVPLKLQEVLYKYFPFIDKNNVIICHKKQQIRCDVLIDDGVHNIIGPYKGLLKTAPHNRKWIIPENLTNQVFRVHCWKHIYEMVHFLFNQKKLLTI